MADTVRTVSVTLKMQISDFEAGAAKATVTMKGLSAEVDGFGKSSKTGFDQASKASSDFSRLVTKNLRDGETAFQSLTRRSTELRGEITKLRSDFASTGDKGVFGNLKQSESDFKTIGGLLKDMGGDVERAAQGGKGLEFNLVNAGIAAAPFLLPVAAGSVLGVLALGGVGAGILGQLKDPAVQVAARGFGESVSESLTQATSAFGPQIVKGLGIAETGVDHFIGDLKPAFDALAPEVSKIATDFTEGLAQAGPILAKSLIAAKPDLEALSRLIGSLPADVASFASGLSIGAEGGARAIDDLTNSVKDLSGELGTDLGAIAATYGEITKLSDAAHSNAQHSIVLSGAWSGAADTLNQFFNPLKFVNDKVNALKDAFGGGSKAADTFDGSVNSLGVDTRNMAPAVVGVSKSVDYLGIAALNAGVPLATTGQSVKSLGEHAGTSDPAVQAIGKSVQSMGEHAGTANLATQAIGFSVQSLGEHAGTSDPSVLAVGASMQSMGEHAGTSNLATQALGISVQSMGEHSGSAIGSLNGLDSSLQSTAPDAQAVSGAMNDLAASISKSSNAALAAAGDQLAVKQSYADFTKTLKENGKTFDENTQKGRNNTQGLLNALGPLQKQYQGQVDAGTATFATTKKYDAQVDKLIDLAKKNGLASGTAEALRKKLESVAGSYPVTIPIHVRVSESPAAAQLLGRATGQRVAFAEGGIVMPAYTHAADGLLTHAQVYSPVNPGRFMIAEPQTGGEGFVPRFGDYGRSMSIIKAEAGWYGARVVEGGGRGGGGGGGTTTIVLLGGDPQGKAFLSTARAVVQDNGGDPVKVFKPR